LPEIVADLLRAAALQDLAFANKAGLVVAGYPKVEKALGTGKTIALVHASDASSDGSRKLDRGPRGAGGERRGGWSGSYASPRRS